MRIFLIGGSPDAQPPAGLAPAPGDRVIAVDHGAVRARAWGWPVHLLVGDLDSLGAEDAAAVIAGGTPVITAPAAKDETDTELAVAQALTLEAREIVICAALGGRADHMLANVLLLARPELAGLCVTLVDGRESIRLLRGGIIHQKEIGDSHSGLEASAGSSGQQVRPAKASNPEEPPSSDIATPAHLELRGAPGDLLSLLPLGGDAIGVTTEGLQYPLHDETLFLGQARGVSNVFTGSTAVITLRRGSLLVIHTVMER